MPDPELLDRLARLRRRIRLLLLLDGAGLTVVAAALGGLAAVALDYAVWLPGEVRVAVGASICGTLAWVLWRRILRPVVTRIDLGEVAGVLDARFDDLHDRLASAVGFMRRRAAPGTSEAMVRRVVTQANDDVQRLPLTSVVRWRRPMWTAVVAVAAVGATAGVGAAAPWFVRTGLQRYLEPFGPVEWPRRVRVEPVTGDATRPTGGWFETRARIVRGQDPSLRVYVHARWTGGRRERFGMTYDARTDQYFHPFRDLHDNVDYWFEAGDDATLDREGAHRITVVPRPAVLEARLTLTDPPYVKDTEPRTLVLQEASVAGVAGSRARLAILTNKPLTTGEQGQADATLTVPGGQKLTMAPADTSGRRFEAAFVARRSGTLSVRTVDEHGFDNRGGTSYALSVRDDEPPHVVIVEPQAVTEVTPAASVATVISADDDFGLTRVALAASVDRTKADRPTEFDLTEHMRVRRTPGRSVGSIAWRWNLRSMALEPGDVVTYRASAWDNYELSGRRHPPGQSAEMRLKVISAKQLADRVRDELMLFKTVLRGMLTAQEAAQDEAETVRGAMDRQKGLSEEQRESLGQLAGRQSRLASRAKHLAGRFGDLVKRLDANASDDRDVRERSTEASQRLGSLAAGAMPRAAEGLQQAGQAKAASEQRQALTAAEKHQEAAAEALRTLLAGMDRWGDFQDVVRHIQQVLDEQERRTESTSRLGRQTLGRQVDELPTKLAAELKQQARQQERLGEDLDRLKQNMARLAEAIRKSDPAAAGALDDAGQAAESGQVARRIGEAAAAIRQNRMAQAQTAQRSVETALRDMFSRLERRQMEQLEVLSKRLKGAVEKVRTLIEDQTKLLAETRGLKGRPDEAAEGERLARRQEGLARAAGAIADEVAKVDGASRPARGVRRGGGRMTRAANRLDQGQHDQAAAEQTEAVKQLTEALETLEKLRAQAEAEMAGKTIQAIAKEIKALRDEQVTLNQRLDGLVQVRSKGRELTRIELRRLDRLGARQRELAGTLEQLRRRVQTAPVYDWVMRLIGVDMGGLADRVDQRLLDAESNRLAGGILERLGHLLAGLEQERPKDLEEKDQFAEGGGGGQGSGATRDKPVPTVAELVVLKAMQVELNRRTRRAELEQQLTDRVSERQLGELRQLGQEQEQIRALTRRIVQGAKR